MASVSDKFKEEWSKNPNVGKLVDKLKRLGRAGDEARKALFPERGTVPVDEWEAKARKAISDIEKEQDEKPADSTNASSGESSIQE